jgi:hypothetical protein
MEGIFKTNEKPILLFLFLLDDQNGLAKKITEI